MGTARDAFLRDRQVREEDVRKVLRGHVVSRVRDRGPGSRA